MLCIFYNQKLYGNVAIEFEGEFLKGFKASDLSVIWRKKLKQQFYLSYIFQAGANYNSQCSIQRNLKIVSSSPFKLKVGRKYKIRAEIDGYMLSLYIDDEKVAEYEDMFPITEGYIGFYSYAPGDAFDNVKIYSKGVAEKISSLDIGDSYYTRGDYPNAALEYTKVANSHKGKNIAYIALHKKALALFNNGKKTEAKQKWKSLLNAPLPNIQNYARIMLTEFSFEHFKDEDVLRELEQLHRNGSASMKRMVGEKLLLFANNSEGDSSIAYLKKYNSLFPQNKLQIFRNNTFFINSIYQCYVKKGDFEKALMVMESEMKSTNAILKKDNDFYWKDLFILRQTARILYDAGRKEECFSTLKKAIEIRKKNLNFESLRAEIYLLRILLFNENNTIKLKSF